MATCTNLSRLTFLLPTKNLHWCHLFIFYCWIVSVCVYLLIASWVWWLKMIMTHHNEFIRLTLIEKLCPTQKGIQVFSFVLVTEIC